MNDCKLPVTVSVPLYGKLVFNMSESTAYAAATRGDFTTMKIGGKVRVPVRAALAKFADGDPEVLKAVMADFAAKLNELMAEEAA